MSDAEEPAPGQGETLAQDVEQLHRLGYEQELARVLGGFSNYAISLSIICILAGGITSFHLGYCGVGGAAIGLGWPLVCLFSLTVALTMGQVASAFPTAGGLYHWASILGGRGWGFVTAWLNLAGLVTVLAAINVGAYEFLLRSLGPWVGAEPAAWSGAKALLVQTVGVMLITFTQAFINHRGIRLTTRLTDFSGYWILFVAALLMLALLIAAGSALAPARLVTFTNYSGARGGGVWAQTTSLPWLFALGALLPAYTVTGFDASAHASEETVGAGVNVPRGIVRSVLVSGIAGWAMLCVVVMAAPDPDEIAASGPRAFYEIVERRLAGPISLALYLGIGVAQYLCGLATVTSASRMVFAFARDGGLPWSSGLRRVSAAHKAPAAAIWATAVSAVLFTLYSPVYATITAVCTIFLYLSYVLPTLLGLLAFRRSWTTMGPWDIGGWYRPLAIVCVVGSALLIAIGLQSTENRYEWNRIALGAIGGSLAALAALWGLWGRTHFPGPPVAMLRQARGER